MRKLFSEMKNLKLKPVRDKISLQKKQDSNEFLKLALIQRFKVNNENLLDEPNLSSPDWG